MRIAILEAGTPPADLADRHGRYDAMIRDRLGDGHAYVTYRVFAGELPAAPEDADAFIVTGSSAGVGDPLPWIEPLADLVRAARGRAKLVGICFGHQLIAHALGGTVRKADAGWGLGIHRYAAFDAARFGGAATLAVIASHQDQVVVPPPGATVIAGNAFTPVGALAYADGDAISCQCHPEFEPGFARALFAANRARDLDEDTRADAIASLDQPHDNAVLARWIAAYLD